MLVCGNCHAIAGIVVLSKRRLFSNDDDFIDLSMSKFDCSAFVENRVEKI